MAEKMLQAELVVTAKDATGAALEAVSGKLAKLGAAAKAVAGAPVRAMRQISTAAAAADKTMAKVGGALAGGYVASKIAGVSRDVLTTYRKFDDLVRYQRAILGLTPEEQKPFIDQAIHAGASTRYNDLQVIEAQLDLAQRGVQRDFIRPIVDAAMQYGQAMNAELPEAAKTIEGILFSTGKHLEDGNTALQVAKHTVNEAVKLAKIGGLDNDDIRGFFKYAGLAGSTAGLSDESIGAMAALMRRSNIGGEEAGVAVRAVAGRLVGPTQQGIAALAAMGIDYGKFTSLPGGLSASNFQTFMALKFGSAVGGRMAAHVGKILADPDVLGSESEFIKQIYGATHGQFGKGKLRAADANKLTKAITDYYKLSVGKVDSDGLLRAMLGAKPTLGQVNALFGQKQGARVMAFMEDAAKFDEYYNKLKETPQDFAQHIADERMGGASGAMTREEGSWKNVETAIGRAWDAQITGTFSSIAHLEQSFAELDGETVRAATAAGAFGAGLASLAGIAKAFELGIGGTAAALSTLISRVSVLGALLSLKGDTPATAPSKGLKWDAPAGWDYTLRNNSGKFGFSPGSTTPGFSRSSSTWWPSWLPGGTEPPMKYEAVDAKPVTAQIEGNATLDTRVTVEASPDFWTKVDTKINNKINAFRNSGGAPETGTTGSTGKSMPEAKGTSQ